MQPTKTIDYIFRFDPQNPSAKPVPRDAGDARLALEAGNRTFSLWMESCRAGESLPGEPSFVVPCNAVAAGINSATKTMPKPSPFAVVVGCSDARVPMEMLFGQGFNDLFVVRVAGNVLGDECLGSVDLALTTLSESVRVVVVLGHGGCGAVTAAVDAYLQPRKFWSKATSPSLRAILQQVFVAVREAAGGLKKAWGADARGNSGYREALINTTICVNAAQTAYNLRQEIQLAGQRQIEVLYGVYDLLTHKVGAPMQADAPAGEADAHLAHAPTNPRDFQSLATHVAERLRSEQR